MKTDAILLDSSVWIEIFSKGPRGKSCLKIAKAAGRILVPTLVIFEVYKKIATKVSEESGLTAVAHMSQNEVIDMDREIALSAADLSIQLNLPMADSIVLAHAKKNSALLVTMDNDFEKIPGVKIIRK